MTKKVHYKLDREDKEITTKDIMKQILEIQRAHPDMEVFFDGDEFAICSRPKKKKK